ncbi:MAG: hypothetical protein ABIJ34_02035 [archaeon]
MEALIIAFIVTVLVFIISALPLHFSIKFLGGKTDLLKTIMVVLISGVIVSAVKYQFKLFGGLIAFFILIWIYHEVFRLKWWKAFVAWFLQFVFIAIFYAVIALLSAAVIGFSVLNM